MNKFELHECKMQTTGVRIEYSDSYFHGKFTWQLIVTREATENDLQKNHYLENIGDDIWSTIVEITHCPFCGAKLRTTKLNQIKFVHFDSSSWTMKRL